MNQQVTNFESLVPSDSILSAFHKNIDHPACEINQVTEFYVNSRTQNTLNRGKHWLVIC